MSSRQQLRPSQCAVLKQACADGRPCAPPSPATQPKRACRSAARLACSVASQAGEPGKEKPKKQKKGKEAAATTSSDQDIRRLRIQKARRGRERGGCAAAGACQFHLATSGGWCGL